MKPKLPLNYTQERGIQMASYVYVKTPNGTTYVYENESYWDKAAQKTGLAKALRTSFPEHWERILTCAY